MLNAILAIFTSRLIWSFLGITAVSSIIWFIGPITSVGNVIPFESSTVRIVAIASLYLVWLFIQLATRSYQAWLNKKLSTSLNRGNDEREQLQDSQYIPLAEHFSDALRLLKNAYFYGLNTQYKPGWSLFNRQYLYQLPWYVLIGAPNSGKTTLLANSGLHFPLADHFKTFTPSGIKGTDNCDWWFTNHAVLLDTTGRYTTQDTLPEQDAHEWQCFTRLLKKYRTRQPLNGVIVTISVEDLLNPSKKTRDQQAYLLRRRLSELHEQCKIQFPIYVIITKTDLLKGFSAYFSHFDKTQRDQIWGFNFPWNKTDLWNKADWNLGDVFEQQYRLLQERLEAELPHILLHLNLPQQCAESYLFPQEFAALRPLIAQYLDIVFAKSGFDIPYSPRGLYFTSGTQEGVPDATSAHRAYFLKNLLENTFQEAGLASQNRWWVYRNRLLRGLGYTILAVIPGLIISLFFISYNNNKNYLMEVQDKIFPILNQAAELKKSTHGIDIYTPLPILNKVADLGKSPHFSLDDPPLSYQMGLYRGEQINNASLTLYTEALQTLLLPQVVLLITSQLRQDNGNNTDDTYDTLKAYQMLCQAQHYDGRFLHHWVMQYLQAHLPPDISQAQLQQIDGHLRQLLEGQVVTSPYVCDNQLIKQKQGLLGSIPPARLVYTHLKQALLNHPNLSPVNLTTLAGPDAGLIFSHINGTPITQDISGMFTPAGYRIGTGKNLNTLIDKLYSQNTWILGRYTGAPNIGTPDPERQAPKEIALLVRQFYIRDYIQQWDNFLAGIHLNNIDNLEQRATIAQLLASDASPIRNLLINISKNVNLDEGLNTSKLDKKIGSFVSHQSGSLTKIVSNQLLPEDNQLTPEQELKEHFAQLIALAKSSGVKNSDDKNKQIPFDNILSQIGKLHEYLGLVQNAANLGIPAPSDNIITQLQATAQHLPVPFKGIVSSLAIGAGSDTQFSNLKNLSKRLNADVRSFCQQAIANRYPLVQRALDDIKPDDMARMFAPQTGIMDSFFQKNLVGKVDTSQANWHFIPGADGKALPGNKSFLQPFQQAQIIRDTLFSSGSPIPSFRVIVRTMSMDKEILSMILDVDGQQLQYSHGPQVSQSLNWPGPNGTNQVRIQLNLQDGTTANLITSGSWALNRLIDHARYATRNPTPGHDASQRVTFNIKGHHVSLEFIPNSIFSPFQLPRFTCPNLTK
ncbi:type VI secretion system membrane subunit TssM [Xenorhabdus sp. DI]|uniref:type VI secretion system membrane subunit TssM n=1 Tax=Xenorhabdus doucetiae TaxID=351671 RepID=UPI0019AFA0EE|nr:MULTISPECIES: type VI secretion system membrane subunit TssM [unclassified Xenorhabdus]MBD2786020.1 type VI secretion system membrane subunit TssM [Xenorhabdus sp. 3]MBD2787228.1 type VI secretion system membrane subunit TssM [Xenorhabdus sp. DI]